MGAARPGARGSRVTASRYALGAEGGGAARSGAYMCPPRNCARCLVLGGVGMSKRSCAARCSRGSVQGVLRAPAEAARVRWHTAKTLLPPPLPRSSGAPVRWLMARGRRASGVAAAPRSREAASLSTRRTSKRQLAETVLSMRSVAASSRAKTASTPSGPPSAVSRSSPPPALAAATCLAQSALELCLLPNVTGAQGDEFAFELGHRHVLVTGLRRRRREQGLLEGSGRQL